MRRRFLRLSRRRSWEIEAVNLLVGIPLPNSEIPAAAPFDVVDTFLTDVLYRMNCIPKWFHSHQNRSGFRWGQIHHFRHGCDNLSNARVLHHSWSTGSLRWAQGALALELYKNCSITTYESWEMCRQNGLNERMSRGIPTVNEALHIIIQHFRCYPTLTVSRRHRAW